MIAVTGVTGKLMLSTAAALGGIAKAAEPANAAPQAKNLSYFSRNYDEARARFREAAVKRKNDWPGAEIRAFAVPSRTEKDLTVDYLYLPAQGVNSERLVVITSGVHGMEGYAGSAIQLMLLNELAPTLERTKTSYLIVHSLNPFGFRRHRRATENNVNLNRNFSVGPELYRSPNPGYPGLRSILEPSGPVDGATWGPFTRSLALIGSVLSGPYSFSSLNQSVGQGQFDWPNGLEYGGKEAEPQIADFLAVTREKAATHSKLILFDLHTGLGARYQLHLMPGDEKGSVDEALFRAIFDTRADESIYAYTPNSSDGFYRTFGDINNVVPSLLAPEARAVAVTVEFGTVGDGYLDKLRTLNRVILENQGFHYGYNNSALEVDVKAAFGNLFYPDDLLWRDNVVERSRALFTRALERLRSVASASHLESR